MAGWNLSQEEFAIVGNLQNESDRAAAIISACILEDRIEDAIKAKLRKDKKAENDLFGDSRPLGGFDAKNKLAFLLRCYGRRLFEELETINTIRNRFAHSHKKTVTRCAILIQFRSEATAGN
jgi:hypothetical protein